MARPSGSSFLAIMVMVAISACSGGCHHKEQAPGGPTAQRRPDRSVVLSDAGAAYIQVERVKPAKRGRAFSFAGRVSFDERHVARLGPSVPGRVVKVNVVTGDPVKAGDPLVVLHATDVAAAQAQVTQAKNARLLADQTAERARMLRKEGAGTEAELQQAESALAQAKSEEQRAGAALSAIGGAQGAAEYVLRSPISGTVIERNVAIGSTVSNGADKPLLTVGDLDTVWVLAEVFEQDLSVMRVGTHATIQVLAMRDKSVEGEITHVTSVVDPATRAAEARIELPNPGLALKPGMFARVFVDSGGGAGVEIPTSALIARRDQFFVFVKQADGSFMQREVHVADQHGEHATISSGLKPDEDVVTEGAILLDVEANEAL
jgi:cobalt-zinc-cadmium efflux system membrane fusion protein